MRYTIVRTQWSLPRVGVITLFALTVLCFGVYLMRYRGIFEPDRCSVDPGERSPDSNRLIFVGGHESSGTSLLRVLLDVHPAIRCGAEPMVTLEVLHLRHTMHGLRRLKAIKAGVYPKAYDQAVAAFILKVMEKMGPPAEYLCHKQPMTFNYLSYLAYLFPNAKFIHVVRDGRAVVASSVTRAFNPLFRKDHLQEALRIWEQTVIPILRDCQDIGTDRCLTLRYERLVMKPREELGKLFDFLNIPWDPIVLAHQNYLANITGLNPYEPSTRQVQQPINTDSLAKWAEPGSPVDQEFLHYAREQSRLLQLLGYAEVGSPPDYTNLTSYVPYVD